MGWLFHRVWVIRGWNCAVRVSRGKCGVNPQIYVKSCTRSLAQAARAVTPLREFRRNGAASDCSPSATASEYIPLATWNSCTRQDLTLSAGLKSVSAVTSSSVGNNPSCASTAAISPSMSCNTGHSSGVNRLCILWDDVVETVICLCISFNKSGSSSFGISFLEQYS